VISSVSFTFERVALVGIIRGAAHEHSMNPTQSAADHTSAAPREKNRNVQSYLVVSASASGTTMSAGSGNGSAVVFSAHTAFSRRSVCAFKTRPLVKTASCA